MYVPLVKSMSSGIFFLFMYKIVRTSGIFLMKNSTLRAIFIAFGTWKKCSTKPKKRLVPHFFCIILREICTTNIVLNISRRYYDDLYQRIDRYHIGGISTTRWRYRPGEQQIVPLRNPQYISTYGYFEIKYKTVRRIQNQLP